MEIPVLIEPTPFLSTQQMIEVDRAMIQDYHIDLVQMMENAGRNLSHLARMRFLDGEPRGGQVSILAGNGGNGGGALVCARRLHNWGAEIQVFITRPDREFTSVSLHQLDILHRMGVQIKQAEEIESTNTPDLIIDGIIGYRLSGAPRGSAAMLIGWANASRAPILALDVPSGVDASSGKVFDPAIKATATMTLALPKSGLRTAMAQEMVGELYLADIGVPPELFSKPPLEIKVGFLFTQSEILRLSQV